MNAATHRASDAITEVIPVLPGGGDHHAYIPYAAPPARSGMRWGWIVLGVVVAVLAVAGLASVAAAHRTMTVSGTAAVAASTTLSPGSGCYQASSQGMPISVYDASGDLVGTTTLTGTSIARNTWNTSYYYADSCEYSFSVPDVPAGDEHYRVKIGSGDGQGVGFTRAQLEAGPVALTHG